MTDDFPLAFLTKLGEEIRKTNNIWDALRPLTEALGAETGQHLENLLLRSEAEVRRVMEENQKYEAEDRDWRGD